MRAFVLMALLFIPSAAAASETITYTYDARGRLVAVVHSGMVNDGVTASYDYDDADNRTNVTVSGVGGTASSSFPKDRVNPTEKIRVADTDISGASGGSPNAR